MHQTTDVLRSTLCTVFTYGSIAVFVGERFKPIPPHGIETDGTF